MLRKILLHCLVIFVVCLGLSKETVAQNCSPPAITSNSKSYNIFSAEQEMVLGELTYQRMSGELRFIRDPQLTAYIKAIGEKLVKHLPQTGLRFQFFIVDLPEANAFNVPGGYVFISRKLIAFAKNEDELAGVIGHELGHAAVRHGASDFSEWLKKILSVTQLGDRKDVTEKYNLLLERQKTKSISRGPGHESEQQLEADRIGLFSMVAAGYDPEAFAAFFDRLVETKGKTGNWFTDVFGKARPEQKRLREMIRVTQQLPAQCREMRQAGASTDFLKWQADVVSYRGANRTETLPGLIWKKDLSPKLRSDISHFAFNDTGKYFLAQDDFAITVMQREPLQILFQIPAPEAQYANFTPDGQFVVFATENLRYEKWSVADRKPVEMRELVVRRDCWEHGLSPDGKYLACVDYGLNLNLIDTQTGKRAWEKKDFYRLSLWEYLTWILRRAKDNSDRRKLERFFHVEFSPDSRTLAVSRSNKFRFSFRIDGMVAAESENTLLALDLTTLKPVTTGGDLKKVTRRPFVFLDGNRILAMAPNKLEDAGVFSFPEGKRLAKFSFGADEVKRTANPNYVIVKPLTTARMGIYDLTRNEVISGFNKVDVAIWQNQLVFESTSGKILLAEVTFDEEKKLLQRKELGSIEIPVGSIGQLRAAEVSDNFQWLAVSSKTRGALWNLSTGDRKLYLRGFRGSLLADDGGGIAEFPKLEPLNHSLVLLNPLNNSAETFRELPEKGAEQYGRFLLVRQSLKAPKKSETEKDKKPVDNETDDASLSREVRLELRDVISDKLIWSRDFPKEAPDFFFDAFSGRLIFRWTLGSDVGKTKLKEDAAIAARARELGNKDDDYLLEVVDAFAGKSVGTLLLETGKGSFDIESGFSEGDWLVLHDSENRVLAYSLKDGALRHRFFGSKAAMNPANNQILVENYPGDLTLYDLGSGDSRAHVNVYSAAVFVRFSVDGKRLFVLTGEQTAYVFDIEKLLAQPNKPD